VPGKSSLPIVYRCKEYAALEKVCQERIFRSPGEFFSTVHVKWPDFCFRDPKTDLLRMLIP
jgi:hypothetical protein